MSHITTRAEFIKQIQEAVSHCLSTQKRNITKGMNRLNDLAKGKGKGVGVDYPDDFVYEYARCHITTQMLQKIKEVHYPTKRWVYVKPLYRTLFQTVFDDLLPDTSIYSNGDMENVVCRGR